MDIGSWLNTGRTPTRGTNKFRCVAFEWIGVSDASSAHMNREAHAGQQEEFNTGRRRHTGLMRGGECEADDSNGQVVVHVSVERRQQESTEDNLLQHGRADSSDKQEREQRLRGRSSRRRIDHGCNLVRGAPATLLLVPTDAGQHVAQEGHACVWTITRCAI